jgi:NAD(P)-dependent dehydrogenase (short-subunit alcohol dehydrogenase family)
MNDVPASALVVIGAGGMGLAVARRLASGRRLLLADYSEASLETALTALRGEGHSAEGHPVDVSDRGSVDKLATAAGSVGRVDAVIHTAGVSPVTATARQIYQVDLLGTAHVIDAFLPVASPGTSLVCVASMAGTSRRCPPTSSGTWPPRRPASSSPTRESTSTRTPVPPTWWPSAATSCGCRPPRTPGAAWARG